MKISNLPNKFKGMIIKMLNELGRRMDEHSEIKQKVRKYKEELNRAEEYSS